MKELNEIEKRYLKTIIELSKSTNNVLIGNIIWKEFKYPNIGIQLDYSKNTVEYLYDLNNYNATTIIDITRELSWELFMFIKLLKYLESKNYIYLYEETLNHTNQSNLGSLASNSTNVASQNIVDKDFIKEFIECNKKVIIVGESIKTYVDNNFRTSEEIRHSNDIKLSKDNLTTAKKTLNVTLWALIITIITSLTNLGFMFFNKEEKLAPIKTENKFQKKIIKILQDIHYDVHNKEKKL